MVRSSSSPSFQPGQSTTWACTWRLPSTRVRKLVEDRRGAIVAEQSIADLEVGRVNAHVQRRDSLVDESLKPAGAEVGQGDVAAVGEGQAEIVVADPQRRARAPADCRR